MQLFDFVVRHKTDCYRAFKLSDEHKGYKTPEGMKLINLVRSEIEYSPRTYNGDIYVVLWKMYKSIVIEGNNNGNEGDKN
jgi:hypothetical protein